FRDLQPHKSVRVDRKPVRWGYTLGESDIDRSRSVIDHDY
ncbi:unnamed protein product, partial [marine sediment metagenome]